jgi:hypothetical protein
MAEETQTTISTKLFVPQSDAANKYKAHVLLTENREISKEEAVNELLAIGAQVVLPRDIFDTLNIELPNKQRRKQTA